MNKDNFEHTIKIDGRAEDEHNKVRQIMLDVYKALKKKGYNPINQLVGYLLSGEPAYITSYNDARSIICQLERDELLEELVRMYLKDLLTESN